MAALEEFDSVGCDDELDDFVERYSLVESTRLTSGEILGVYVGLLDNQLARLTHRWYEPSGPFQTDRIFIRLSLQLTGIVATKSLTRARETLCRSFETTTK